MKASDIINLSGEINKLNNLTGIKFVYAINKNKKIILNAANKIKNGLNKLSPELIKLSEEFGEEHNKIIEKNAKVDQNGNFISKGLSCEISNMAQYLREKKSLEARYKKLIDAEKELKEDNEVLLDKEIDIKFHKIKLIDVPANITIEQMGIIEDMIEE